MNKLEGKANPRYWPITLILKEVLQEPGLEGLFLLVKMRTYD
ncbi:hypothetical protein [Peribacillus sp. NPDC097295]